jgi:hypothetical protein
MNVLRDSILAVALAALYLTASATEPRPQTDDVSQGRTGIVTHMGPGYPANYLALPIGPGHRVRLCGPRQCLVLTSTDAGPNRASLEAGRIADVSVELFARLCCDPSQGGFSGSWRVVGASPTLPPTDTAP